MSVEKTVDLCRKSTHSEMIKSVLESATFSTPKEVVAKMVTQIDKVKVEHQVLAFRSNQRGNNGRGRGGNRNNHRGYRSNNGYNNNNNNNNNGQNRNNNRRNQNYRGRGNNRNNNNSGNNNNNNRNVHVVQGNPSVPQAELGANI